MVQHYYDGESVGSMEQGKPTTVVFGAVNVPMAARADVLVAGGGPAGVAAAVGAARAGAKVLLLEQEGFLGGVSTRNLYLRLSTLQGEGVRYRIIGGLAWEFVQRVLEAGGGALILGHLSLDYEMAKCVWDEMALQSGVHVLLNTTAFDVLKEGEAMRGVLALNKSGLQAFTAHTVIDCSGDGDIAARAGAPFEVGRAADGLMQPVTMMMRFGGVDLTAFHIFLARDPHLRRTITEAIATCGIALNPSGVCINYWSGRPDVLNLNLTQQAGVDGTDAAQLSAAETEGRRHVWLLSQFLRQHVAGFENAWLIDTAAHVGVRETRRFVGEYVLTERDVMEGREFADTVALGSYPVDIHDPEGGQTRFVHIKAPCYGIPYRCLLPLQVENLLVAGRNISATHEALGSTRVMFTCMAIGQAVGIAAALASKDACSVRRVDVGTVQQELLRQGAILSGEQARTQQLPATLATDAEVAQYILQNYG